MRIKRIFVVAALAVVVLLPAISQSAASFGQLAGAFGECGGITPDGAQAELPRAGCRMRSRRAVVREAAAREGDIDGGGGGGGGRAVSVTVTSEWTCR